ncbi:MAG: glycosyltransferase [Muribaculaceae bacterium]|nr:glycosyltransferase [Roseburia sp.]MCM1432033.1 glycosyltransferase [Muribaculaceae bacterium]MCM1493714.1 glycosyltransferase [Muribaculaceae bacterium]
MITCYNHEKYIKECLESILTLKYSRVELLIIDDASTDDSFTIINSYKTQLQGKVERLIIEKNEKNMGIGKTRNRLLNQAKGDYLKFLDSDDFLLPWGIDLLVEHFEENPKCNIAHGSALLVDKEGKEVTKRRSKGIPSGYNLTGRLLEGNFIYAPCAMISKKTVEEYGYFKEIDLGEDWEYWLRVSVDGRIDYIDEKISAYRILQSSASHFTAQDQSRFLRSLKEEIFVFDLYEQYATKKIVKKYYNSLIKRAYLCGNRNAIDIVRNKMKENGAKMSLSTLICIFVYETNI